MRPEWHQFAPKWDNYASTYTPTQRGICYQIRSQMRQDFANRSRIYEIIPKLGQFAKLCTANPGISANISSHLAFVRR